MLSATGADQPAALSLYKYKNHEGTTIITSDQKSQLADFQSLRAEQERQSELDQELLFLYVTLDEIDGAKNPKLNEFDQKIREMQNLEVITTKNIDDKRLQIKKTGEKAPEHLHKELRAVKKQPKAHRNYSAPIYCAAQLD